MRTFTAQPARKIRTMNVLFKRQSVEMAMEFGSLKELAGYIQDESTALAAIFGDDMETVISRAGGGSSEGTEQGGAPQEVATDAAAPKKRGPKPKNQPDPSTASTPPPLAIPALNGEVLPPVAPAAPAPAADGGIPDFLKRQADAAAAPPPPPPPAPAPVAPPSGILAGKVIAAMDLRGTTDAAKTQLVDWLAAYGVVNKGVTYDETVSVIRLMTDDKLGQIATALAVA